MRSLICATLLVGSAVGGVAFVATPEQSQTSAHEGVQEKSQTANPTQRAAATRAFLGLGAEPDKAAAERGAPLFAQNCAFCHGPNARGATGPNLITSDKVLADDKGEHLMPFLRKGILEKGMPAFATMSDQQLTDIAEFLHLQVDDVANRGTYHVLNILVGNATEGKAYVESHCMGCHTAQTFAHIAGKYRSPEQLQRNWIWPVRDEDMTAQIKTADGTISGKVTQISDFRISLVTEPGEAKSIDLVPGVEVQIHDPLVAHEQIVMKLRNDEMHNVTAYFETLK
ncbi:c-type cytochrome [Acidicapsa dinghuensis]|uniref:C-type cytochrome n=1 Tax=Acidicapsa dinghuensis TaxID=2218256 RepID=A0ABW1EG57_9BACT